MSAPPDQHLQTKFVFVDTEAFRQAQFDWGGTTLSRLVQFAKEGHLRLLITDITKREVSNHLHERLAEAMGAVKKHEIVLRQLGGGNATAALSDPAALTKREQAFEEFLKATNAINVETVASIGEVFSDYFALRPPFSQKKKAEFPDAVVIASLRAWCAERNTKAYVVSGDQEMAACCSGSLLHATSIKDIISQATVSKEVHDALQEALFQSEELSESLSEQVRELTVVRGDLRMRRLSGIVYGVDDVNVHSVDVLRREGLNFTCEIEFEAALTLRLEIEQEEQFGYTYDDYEPRRVYRTEKSLHRNFIADIELTFDPQKPDELELQDVYVAKEDVELDIGDLRG